MNELSGKKVLVAVSNRGVEQDELIRPVRHLREAGAEVTVAAPKPGDVQTLVGDWDLGEKVPVDRELSTIDSATFDLLVLPGGTLNADKLRLDSNAQSIARDFASSGRPIASICHGAWLLVETGLVKGRDMTAYKSLKTDVLNAGGNWKDEPAVRCASGDWVLITSRNPGDLDAFNRAIADELAG